MNCSACGATLLAGAKFCSRCGTSPGGYTSPPIPPAAATIQARRRSGLVNVIVGFFIVLIRAVTLPFTFVVDTFRMLARIGEAGSVEESIEADLPFISWFVAAARVFVTVTALLGYLGALIFGVALGDEEGLAVFLVGSGAVLAWIWISAVSIELVLMGIWVVRNTRRSAEVLERRGQALESRSEK